MMRPAANGLLPLAHRRAVLRLCRSIRALARCRRGAIAISFAFTAVSVVASIMVAVEASRLQQVEARLQIALDAAALAGTRDIRSATLTSDVRQVFDANFLQADPLAEVTAFRVIPFQDAHGIQKLRLEAEARLSSPLGGLLDTASLDWLEVATFNETVRSTRGIELVMVVDATGSMCYSASTKGGSCASTTDQRMYALRDAASELVDVLFGGPPAAGIADKSIPNLWVGIVPYVASVNVGPRHHAWLEAAGDFGGTSWKGCVLEDALPDGVTVSTAVDDTRFDVYLWPEEAQCAGYDNDDNPSNKYNCWRHPRERIDNRLPTGGEPSPNFGCGTSVLPLTASYQAVTDKIAELQPAARRFGTHTDVGLAWGWRSLSEAWQGRWLAPVASGDVAQSKLPLDADTRFMEKVMVLMTDGGNRVLSNNDYTAYGFKNDIAVLEDGASVTITGHGMNDRDLDRQMLAICDGIKGEGIILYTVAFGPAGGTDVNKSLVERCASEFTDGIAGEKYFDAPSAAALRRAFNDIGGQLTELRLTQ